jgi:polysaccharide biosynthesis protein PslH
VATLRQLLYVSPVVPDLTGSGLAMRAGTMLRLLAERYDVSLLVVPLHGRLEAPIPARITSRCRAVAVVGARSAGLDGSPLLAALDAMRMPRPDTARLAFAGQSFDVVHLYRLTALPCGLPYLVDRGTVAHIDIDECESASRRRHAELFERTGHGTVARFLRLESGLWVRLEREVLARFDRVYTCSAAERVALPDAPGRAGVRILTNALDAPDGLAAAPPSEPFTLLFVGTLAYPANEDAVRFLCDDVLPHLRRMAPRRFDVVLVGAGAGEAVHACAAAPDVTLVGEVPDVAPWYANASTAVVPLRAGGGTRLKVLEAMRHGRPIVSTTEGVAGLGLEDGTHVLVADTPEQFARQCARLMVDPALAERLRRQAFDRFVTHHTPQAVAGALDG